MLSLLWKEMPINFAKYLQYLTFTVMWKRLEKELSICLVCYSNRAARKQKALFVEENTLVLIYFTTLLREKKKKVKQCITL